MNIEDKKKKYLQACRIMDMYNEKYKLCKIKTNNSGRITCAGIFCRRSSLCCEGCSHLTDKGCDTSSLGCKLSFCYIANSPYVSGISTKYSKENKRFELLSKIILDYIDKHKIPFYWIRMSMEDSFECKRREESGAWVNSFYDKRKSIFKY